MPRSTKPALYQLLDDVNGEIDALDVNRDAPAMLEQIKRARPDFAANLEQSRKALEAKGRSRAAAQAAADAVALAVGSFIISKVKEIPAMVQTLIDAVNTRSTDPAVR